MKSWYLVIDGIENFIVISSKSVSMIVNLHSGSHIYVAPNLPTRNKEYECLTLIFSFVFIY